MCKERIGQEVINLKVLEGRDDMRDFLGELRRYCHEPLGCLESLVARFMKVLGTKLFDTDRLKCSTKRISESRRTE